MKKEQELLVIVQKNDQKINAVQSGELKIETVELNKAEIEIREKKIFLDRHIIEASDNARITVLERERKLIKA